MTLLWHLAARSAEGASPSAQARRIGRRLATAAALLPIAAGLCACSSDVNPMKAAFVGAGHGPKEMQAPDFVANSRREGVGYMPVGEDAPKRAIRARSSEGQKALAAELEGARSRNEARGKAAEGAGKSAGKDLSAPSAPPTP
ncbi:hypothetical protein MMB17_18010 [Methylobacterium organophilum]|uniref:hypothetical protein n=1 Tax=Methylobacterium organophilum TaxID=410 RepID=UPI001F12FD9F|nr:hypothetical protein [Methylobacterium organophilum]UMY16564.1 hypothetical protein MMB17_18010 [Methylobacterium organophilum]